MSRREVVDSAREAASARLGWLWQVLFVAAHIPLATMIPRASPYIVLHARLAFGLGLVAALTSRRWERVACAGAYIAGSEVFWRMKRADLPWEFGKYALVLIFLIAIVRFGNVRRGMLPIVYFALLLPSAILTGFGLDRTEARDQLSFSLAGPLALAASVMFFSSLRLSRAELKWMYVCLVAPIVSVAVVGFVTLQQNMPEEFGTGSNALTSGGYGPNQVSALLGLGVLAAVLYLVVGGNSTPATVAFVVLALFFFRQCAITFSRGGLYMAVGGIAAGAFYLARDRRSRLRLAGLLVIVLPILLFVVWPRLEVLTAGALGERFRSTESTGRDLLIKADLKTWSENPILGTGPGLAAKNRLRYFRVPTAHTEYSRLLSEHGTLGLAALAVLFAMALSNVRRAPTRLEKSLAAAMIAYSLLHLAVDGMRLAAASFAFGISGVRLLIPRRCPAASALQKKPRVRIAASLG